VHWQVPLGDPPASGWPVVLMFQGSLFSAELTWIATDDLPFGAFHQTRVVKALLDHGFAVITPGDQARRRHLLGHQHPGPTRSTGSPPKIMN
jgi:hypothetical protein